MALTRHSPFLARQQKSRILSDTAFYSFEEKSNYL
jgi:hypothetical protein